MIKESTFKNYPEARETREDLNALKHDAVDLGKRIQAEGKNQVLELKDYLLERLGHLQDAGRHQVQVVEDRVKKKPGQTLALAFAAGIVTSYLLGRR